MSEPEDFDELPPITVNTSMSDDVSTFVMPSAEVLATKRAREEECERELLALRSRACDVTLAHSDSSGSEGEAALAAAVHSLSVAPASRAAALAPAEVLALLRPHLAPDVAAALPEHLDVTRTALHIARSLDASWARRGALAAGAVLLACLARAPAPRPRRALHALLDERDARVARELARAGAAALQCAQLKLRLSDACRSGARLGADVLADELVWSALDVPAPHDACALERVARSWRTQGAAVRLCGAALLSRALAARPPPAPPALLAALAPPAQAASGHKDLQVVVYASKVRLLFRSEK